MHGPLAVGPNFLNMPSTTVYYQNANVKTSAGATASIALRIYKYGRIIFCSMDRTPVLFAAANTAYSDSGVIPAAYRPIQEVRNRRRLRRQRQDLRLRVCHGADRRHRLSHVGAHRHPGGRLVHLLDQRNIRQVIKLPETILIALLGSSALSAVISGVFSIAASKRKKHDAVTARRPAAAL